MALTEAGRRLLRRGKQAELFEELVLRDPTAAQGLVPWDGQSPRDLTEAHIAFSLAQEGREPNAVDAQIDEQCRRHLYGW